MRYIIVKDGRESIMAEAVRYLESRGITREEIKELTINGQVGDPLTVTVTLYVLDDRDNHKSHYGAPEHTINHPGSDRWTGGDRKDEDVHHSADYGFDPERERHLDELAGYRETLDKFIEDRP